MGWSQVRWRLNVSSAMFRLGLQANSLASPPASYGARLSGTSVWHRGPAPPVAALLLSHETISIETKTCHLPGNLPAAEPSQELPEALLLKRPLRCHH